MLAGSLLLAAASAHALIITVTGNPGTSGPPGVDGGPGDPADAVAISTDPSNQATATGGDGGNGAGANGGAGGAASATAESNPAAGPAIAIATATGGDGGDATGATAVAGTGGAATAAAEAHGAGGSAARAIATGGRGGFGAAGAASSHGGDAVLVDAVSGSDPVALELQQLATGGIGAISGPGDNGDAVSTGDFGNAAGGDLVATLVADGTDAHVGGSATSTGAGDATLVAIGRAGGTLVIDPLLAHATGSGGASASLEAVLFADGASLALTNRVDAVSDGGGAIHLRQSVEAPGGSESVLDVTRSAAQLDLQADAEGGDATIFVRGVNDAGGVSLGGVAEGDGFSPADPLDALAEFEAQTSGDGHDIEIGSTSRPARAVGGGGDNPVRGGAAEATANAVALGNSAVHVEIEAQGGEGGDFFGGDATARASGTGGGTETVDVTATALGGEGFVGIGGDALAEADATGLGTVEAHAIALGGFHYEHRPPPGSGGFALARANGASGVAEAVAGTNQLFDGEQADSEQDGPVTVGLTATVDGETAVAASSHMNTFGDGPLDPVDGFIRSAYQAEAPLLAAALAGNPQALAAPAPVPADEVFALVEVELASGGGIARTFTADIVIGNSFDQFDPQPERVLISFLDPELDAATFGSLTLRSFDTRDPSDVYEIVFTNALDALAFLDDGRLSFGGLPRERHLELVFETTGAEGGLFLDFLVAAVPEPSAAVLLALAALVIASRRS